MRQRWPRRLHTTRRIRWRHWRLKGPKTVDRICREKSAACAGEIILLPRELVHRGPDLHRGPAFYDALDRGPRRL